MGGNAVSGAPAVVIAAQKWSGEELLGHAAGAARWLSRSGLPEGVPVPALLQASPEALALVLAGAAVSRPIAPLGPRLTVRELAGCIEHLAAPCVVTQPDFADIAATVAPGRKVLVLGELPCPALPRRAAAGPEPAGCCVGSCARKDSKAEVPSPPRARFYRLLRQFVGVDYAGDSPIR